MIAAGPGRFGRRAGQVAAARAQWSDIAARWDGYDLPGAGLGLTRRWPTPPPWAAEGVVGTRRRGCGAEIDTAERAVRAAEAAIARRDRTRADLPAKLLQFPQEDAYSYRSSPTLP